jgi:hypothetical protein
MASNAANQASRSRAATDGRMPAQAPPFDVIGWLSYDPVTDTLTSTAMPNFGPPVSVKVEHFIHAQ